MSYTDDKIGGVTEAANRVASAIISEQVNNDLKAAARRDTLNNSNGFIGVLVDLILDGFERLHAEFFTSYCQKKEILKKISLLAEICNSRQINEIIEDNNFNDEPTPVLKDGADVETRESMLLSLFQKESTYYTAKSLLKDLANQTLDQIREKYTKKQHVYEYQRNVVPIQNFKVIPINQSDR